MGHLSSPRDVHMKWVRLLEEEFFRQGDSEKVSGLSVSPLMDREKNGITMSQVGLLKGCRFTHCEGGEFIHRKPWLTSMMVDQRPEGTHISNPILIGNPARHHDVLQVGFFAYPIFVNPDDVPQVGFFDIVALPLFQSFAQAFADATPLLEAVKDNYNMWRDQTVSGIPQQSAIVVDVDLIEVDTFSTPALTDDGETFVLTSDDERTLVPG